MKSLKLIAPKVLRFEFDTALPLSPQGPFWPVSHVGVCKTDYHLYQHPKKVPVTLGHEVVVQRDSQYFALNNEVTCEQCSYCRDGLLSHCENIEELGVNQDGGYAELIAAPPQQLYPLEDVPPETGTLVEPLACAIHCAKRIETVAELLPVRETRVQVLLIGGGVSGRLVAYALYKLQPSLQLSLYDINAQAAHSSSTDYLQALDSTRAEQFDVVIECSGSNQGLEHANSACRRGGIIVIYGMPGVETQLPLSALDTFSQEKTIVPSMAGCNEQTMSQACQWIGNDQAFFQSLIGKQITLEQTANELASGKPSPGTRTVVQLSHAEEVN